MGFFSDLLKEAAKEILTEVVNEATGFDSDKVNAIFTSFYDTYDDVLPDEKTFLNAYKGLSLLESFPDFDYLENAAEARGEDSLELDDVAESYMSALKMKFDFSRFTMLGSGSDDSRRKEVMDDYYDWVSKDGGITAQGMADTIARLKGFKSTYYDMNVKLEKLINDAKSGNINRYSELSAEDQQIGKQAANYCCLLAGIFRLLGSIDEFIGQGFIDGQKNVIGLNAGISAIISMKDSLLSYDLSAEDDDYDEDDDY